MIVKPLKDKVLIAEGKKDTVTDSGIILDAVSYTHLTLPTKRIV